MNNTPNKIIVITVSDSRNYPNHFWEEPLRKNSKNLIWIDLKKYFFNYGKNKTKNFLINLLKKEKPDYIFMFDSLYYDLDLPFLLTELKKISPSTKSVFFSGDDDLKFDSVAYLGLFFDYVFIAQNDYIPKYLKWGVKNAIFITQTKPSKVLATKKIYDVSFIGTPKSDRNEVLEYLHKNGVNVKVFGYNWDKYPKLKEIYGGVLSSEDYMKIISQSKINLCFSKNMFGTFHMKGRFLEISHCKEFSLVENSPQLRELFIENKEIVFFKNNEDLLKKIKYYLKNEKERENIANNAYKKVIQEFDFEKKIEDFIKNTYKKDSTNSMPKLDYSIIDINKKIMQMKNEDILKLVKDKDYISFSKGKVLRSRYKNYLQVYSLKKSKKEISSSDYFISSRNFEEYAMFRYAPFGKGPDKNYQRFLDINQIVMTKNFFMKNFEKIKKAYNSGVIDFVNNENTSFVSLPLVKITNFRNGFFDDKEFSEELGLFLFSAHRELYSRRKSPLKFLIYSLFLIKEGLSGKKFIFNQLSMKFKDKTKI